MWTGIQKILKSLTDVTLALLALIVFSPIIISLIIIIPLFSKHKALFTQARPGLNGKIFRIYKFQTMLPQVDGENLPDEVRLTKLGRILRKTSIDELPQLFNVLKGELSLVGPRPLLVEYLPLYSSDQMRRHDVKPGITGWAQINGRNAISWEEKFKLDLWYVDNWSLLLDIKIIFITALKVIKRSGVNSSSNITMERFTGTKSE